LDHSSVCTYSYAAASRLVKLNQAYRDPQTPGSLGRRKAQCVKSRVTAAKVQAAFAVLRDTMCWVAGLLGIAYQQVTGKVSVELLLTYMAIIGIPGAVGLVKLSRGREETRGTAESSSASQQSSSRSPSSSPLGDGET